MVPALGLLRRLRRRLWLRRSCGCDSCGGGCGGGAAASCGRAGTESMAGMALEATLGEAMARRVSAGLLAGLCSAGLCSAGLCSARQLPTRLWPARLRSDGPRRKPVSYGPSQYADDAGPSGWYCDVSLLHEPRSAQLSRGIRTRSVRDAHPVKVAQRRRVSRRRRWHSRSVTEIISRRVSGGSFPDRKRSAFCNAGNPPAVRGEPDPELPTIPVDPSNLAAIRRGAECWLVARAEVIVTLGHERTNKRMSTPLRSVES